MALGLTQTLPEKERLNLTDKAAENNIAFLMGGRVAEELIFNNFTTGAGNDIERATEIARRMVCEWGMSKLGPHDLWLQTLHDLAHALVQREVLDGSEVDMIVAGKTLADVDEERRKRAEILKAQNIDPNLSDVKKDTPATGVDISPKPVRA
ncbi:unnamed protein product [Sphagnum balticum]